MNIKAIVHEVPNDEGGGYWAEVPALPGCVTQGESYRELLDNLQEAVTGWLAIDRAAPDETGQVIEIAV